MAVAKNIIVSFLFKVACARCVCEIFRYLCRLFLRVPARCGTACRPSGKIYLIFKDMKVAIIMGSTSDLDIMSQAINVLEGFGVEVVKRVISAHRTPDLMCEFAKSAKENGIGVIIAGAGGAAHVAGVVAGMTTVPVIGVPIQTKALGGMDSLLSIVQMPAGIPVATMAINGAKNAGLFAAQILALTDAELSAKLDAFRAEQTQKVLDAAI